MWKPCCDLNVDKQLLVGGHEIAAAGGALVLVDRALVLGRR
jgi:hypothetical protein